MIENGGDVVRSIRRSSVKFATRLSRWAAALLTARLGMTNDI